MLRSTKGTGVRTALPLLTVAALSLPFAPVGAQSLVSPAQGGAVAVTSPDSGARVGGSVPVSADVSSAGAALVADVQFKVDGFDFGAAVASPPYRTTWNASSASDGWHTLSAVARDSTGRELGSDSVTVRVSNNAPPPVPVIRREDTDPSLSFSPGWMRRNPADWLAWSGGSAMQSMVPGATVTFGFSGTSVSWIGYRSSDSGIAKVLVDDVAVAEVDLFAKTDENAVRVFTVYGLTSGPHVLTIEVTGRQNPESALNNIVVDALDVPGVPVSHLQDTDPDIAYSAGWSEETSGKPWSGKSAAVSSTPGARATLTFTGTAISWRGYRGADTGIARVSLDGSAAAEIDTYSPAPKIQDTLFSAENLDAGIEHTLSIEVTGRQHADSAGSRILLDGFDVTTGLTERSEQQDWAVSYSGDWVHNQNKPWSEGTSAVSHTAGARATFRFAGRSVRWIGFRAARTGIARVYLDGEPAGLVDLYVPSGEGFQDTVFAADGLADAEHELIIEVTGNKNPAATNNYVVVDAFDVGR